MASKRVVSLNICLSSKEIMVFESTSEHISREVLLLSVAGKETPHCEEKYPWTWVR